MSDPSIDDQLAAYERKATLRIEAAQRSSHGQTRQKNWKNFAAVAGTTLALTGTADAEVQFFSPPSPLRLQLMGNAPGSDDLQLDIDGDGGVDLDFHLSLSAFNNGSADLVTRSARVAGGIAQNMVIGSSNYAFNVFSGAVVSNSFPQTFDARIFQQIHSVTSSDSHTSTNGEWDAASTGLMGAKFRIPQGNTFTDHFAWIRVKTAFDEPGKSILEILNWAYEDLPGAPIRAGDEVGQPTVIGDFDGNHVVEQADFLEWKKTFGLNRIPGEGADGNGNGVVDAADYTIWRDHFFSAPANEAAFSGNTTPEPATLALLMLASGYIGIAGLRWRS